MVQKLTGGVIIQFVPFPTVALAAVSTTSKHATERRGGTRPGQHHRQCRANEPGQHRRGPAAPALPGSSGASARSVCRRRRGGIPSGDPDNFKRATGGAALLAHRPLLQAPATADNSRFALPVERLKETVMTRLDPATTIASRVASLISFSGPRDPRDALEPIMAAPEFPQPMYEALRDLSQDLLLPGLNDVPAGHVSRCSRPTRASSRPTWSASTMRWPRELLWRDYPTDQRGTYFRQFWDTRGQTASAPDIRRSTRWVASRSIGQNADRGPDQSTGAAHTRRALRRYPVGDLLRRARRTATGQPRPGPGTPEVYPIFQGTLEPDVRFVGFNLTVAQARGTGTPTDLGYFFIIQQQPTEARFGQDVDEQSPPPFLDPTGNAAKTARALVQPPFRVAIHAKSLLP